MKKFIIQFIALIVVIFGALSLSTGRVPTTPFNSAPTEASKVVIGSVEVKVEIADTPDERKKGLGGRENLNPDEGMLFIFPKADHLNFWMKGVSFPIDIIWIREEKVIDITKNAPPQAAGQKDADLPIYTPNEPADRVLEVSAGFADSHGIKIGDNVKLN